MLDCELIGDLDLLDEEDVDVCCCCEWGECELRCWLAVGLAEGASEAYGEGNAPGGRRPAAAAAAATPYCDHGLIKGGSPGI